jgi:hypothetical protein
MLIVIDRAGRLGNRLQLCAFALAYAIEREQEIAMLALHEYSHLFRGCEHDALSRHPPRRGNMASISMRFLSRPVWRGVLGCLERLTKLARVLGVGVLDARKYPGLLLNNPANDAIIRDSKVVILRGYYFFAPRLLARRADQVRDYFRPVSTCEDAIARVLKRARKEGDVLVGVHIRHGDYREWRGGAHFFTFREYGVAMARMTSLLSSQKVLFLVCSDAILPWDTFPNHGMGGRTEGPNRGDVQFGRLRLDHRAG